MELLLISVYTAVCIALFAVLRIPLSRRIVPVASISGVLLVFAVIQLLNYYHPYSGVSRQYVAVIPNVTEQAAAEPMMRVQRQLVAWFQPNSLLRLEDGSAAEVSFAGIPGKVFSGELHRMPPGAGGGHDWAREKALDPSLAASPSRIPVLINITDSRYAAYATRLPAGSRAQTAVYGDELRDLATLRKTLLRMSAWMNYLSLSS